MTCTLIWNSNWKWKNCKQSILKFYDRFHLILVTEHVSNPRDQ